MKQNKTLYPSVFFTFVFLAFANLITAQCHPICPGISNPSTFLYIAPSNVWCFYNEVGNCNYSTGGEIPLPVELGAFTARQVDKNIEISWSTYSEENSDKFQLLRSHDAHDFELIANIKSKGSSNTFQAYSFTDESPLPGNNYYMLVQKDFDQTESYSKIITAELSGNKALEITAIRNSGAQTLLNVYAEKDMTLQMFVADITGKLITRNTVSLRQGMNDVVLDLPAAGMYVLNLFNDRNRLTEKVLK